MNTSSEIHLNAVHAGWHPRKFGEYVRHPYCIIIDHSRDRRAQITSARMINEVTGERIHQLTSRDRDKAARIREWIGA